MHEKRESRNLRYHSLVQRRRPTLRARQPSPADRRLRTQAPAAPAAGTSASTSLSVRGVIVGDLMLTPTLGQLPDYGALDWSVPLAHAIHRSARGVPPRMSGRLHLEYLQALRLGKALTSAFARNR